VPRPKAERPAKGWRVDDPEGAGEWEIDGPVPSYESGYPIVEVYTYRTKAAAIRATHLWAPYAAALTAYVAAEAAAAELRRPVEEHAREWAHGWEETP